MTYILLEKVFQIRIPLTPIQTLTLQPPISSLKIHHCPNFPGQQYLWSTLWGIKLVLLKVTLGIL